MRRQHSGGKRLERPVRQSVLEHQLSRRDALHADRELYSALSERPALAQMTERARRALQGRRRAAAQVVGAS